MNRGIDAYEGLTVSLAADISVTNMVGIVSNPFSGTFEGGGHSLVVDISAGGAAGATFGNIRGATIRNLIVSGTVNGAIHCSGMVGSINSSDSLIENCTVSAMITSSAAYCGGFVGHGGKMSKTTVRN